MGSDNDTAPLPVAVPEGMQTCTFGSREILYGPNALTQEPGGIGVPRSAQSVS